MEEVIRVVEEYKNICLETAKRSLPKHVDSFMNILFEPKLLVDNIWLPLEQAWEEYKKEHGIN